MLFINRVIERRFSSMVSQTNAQLVAGGSHGGDVFNGEANTTDAAKVSRVEVIAEPDRFDVSNVGTVEETLNLINPQKSGINHSQILNDTIERVKKRLTGDCLKLFGNFDPSNYLAITCPLGLRPMTVDPSQEVS